MMGWCLVTGRYSSTYDTSGQPLISENLGTFRPLAAGGKHGPPKRKLNDPLENRALGMWPHRVRLRRSCDMHRVLLILLAIVVPTRAQVTLRIPLEPGEPEEIVVVTFNDNRIS